MLVFISICVFKVWPKTALLLPVWPRDIKRLDTPEWSMSHSSVLHKCYFVHLSSWNLLTRNWVSVKSFARWNGYFFVACCWWSHSLKNQDYNCHFIQKRSIMRRIYKNLPLCNGMKECSWATMRFASRLCFEVFSSKKPIVFIRL